MPTSDYTPAVADVGAILRSRTVDTNGSEVGTFTPATRPTETQVANLIVTAVGEVEARVGSDLRDSLHGMARTAATYRAAALVEISYYPEQVASGRSPYDQLNALWLETVGALESIASGSGDPGSTPGSPPAPVGAFPTGVVPLDALLGLPHLRGYHPGVYQ